MSRPERVVPVEIREKMESGAWWLAQRLSMEQRRQMSSGMIAERRRMIIHWRVLEAEQKFDEARSKRMARWLKGWVRAEAFREMSHDAPASGTLKHWLRHEFVEAIKGAFKGRDMETAIGSIIRAEVAATLGLYGRDTPTRARKLNEMIQKIVAEEVRKQVVEALSFDVNVKGRVFSPAANQRRVDLGGEEIVQPVAGE